MTAFGSTASAAYRADGLRASKTTSAGTTYFLYDGAEPIVEMNSSGTVTATNIFAPDGLVARQTSSATNEYVFDQQGNVADRTNTSGAIQTVSQYDAWGNEMAVTGTPTDPFGYNAQSGYYLDRETGLYLCQHRFYDPTAGRWVNRDPIGYGGGTNLYGYSSGAPVGGIDSSGLQVAVAVPATGPPLTLVQGGGGLTLVEGGGGEAAAVGGSALGVLGAAVAAGLGIGYAAGTGLDHLTGGGWGRGWAHLLGSPADDDDDESPAVAWPPQRPKCEDESPAPEETETPPFETGIPGATDENGQMTQPDPAAEGRPHTRLRSKKSGDRRHKGKVYTQGFQYGDDGKFEGRWDTWDGRGKPYPHFHGWGGNNGGYSTTPIPFR